jgi:hypothetical protein
LTHLLQDSLGKTVGALVNTVGGVVSRPLMSYDTRVLFCAPPLTICCNLCTPQVAPPRQSWLSRFRPSSRIAMRRSTR